MVCVIYVDIWMQCPKIVVPFRSRRTVFLPIKRTNECKELSGAIDRFLKICEPFFMCRPGVEPSATRLILRSPIGRGPTASCPGAFFWVSGLVDFQPHEGPLTPGEWCEATLKRRLSSHHTTHTKEELHGSKEGDQRHCNGGM